MAETYPSRNNGYVAHAATDLLHNAGMMSLQKLRDRLNEPGVSLAQIAKLSGVASLTVARVRDGTNKPNLDTFMRLEAAVKGRAAPPKPKVREAALSQDAIDHALCGAAHPDYSPRGPGHERRTHERRGDR
jgi:transcriptional regulator with XRE-family HTH domain